MKITILLALVAVASALPRTPKLKGSGGSIKVIGGEEAGEKEFPFFASIQQAHGVLHYIPICGAAIISEKHILTSARCAVEIPNMVYRVVAGDHECLEESGFEQLRSVETILIHENFNATTLDNDIALLVLDTALIFTDKVQPIRMAEFTTVTSGEVVIAGFGETATEYISTVLRKATLSIINHEECEHDFESVAGAPAITQNMVCAFNSEKSACARDPGGPLVAKDEAGRKYLAGLTSWAVEPCVGHPSVFTNLAPLTTWVESKLI